ncbi:TonB-dependent receptor [Ferrimonas balearica]|uniref:TonB-dependent receptor n=1 Tax=Ferrimonas balearica TaxID=44012 RepID=UPI001C99267C|nr:TonB-dependent receptor [Ferrimonas balearica]MBY5922341.1 TonB-dependent receptor [Ferrimonas balearica]MBY5994319.1 TonB-dependent receptor [Ferrimonas balearica]
MNSVTFKRTKLATSLSLALGMGVAAPVVAADEEASTDKVEVIEVRGIRGSLLKSMDMKRDSDGVVDAINAEDIGKFPDTNLAESMQRITGVAIDRQNGEGSRVTVRGFGPDQNLVMLNHRQMPVTTGSRSFDFSNIASDSVSAVVVEKTSQAKNPTGGIGATINVLTLRPLSSPGLNATFGVKAVDDHSTSTGGVTPELSGLYSQTFNDDKFGVLISASYQERESGNRQAQVGTGWRSFPGIVDQDWGGSNAEWGGVPKDDNQINRPGDDDVYSVPQTTIYRFEEQQRKRTNGQLVLQYEPVDSIRATLDYTYFRNDVDTQFNDVSAWFTFVPSENTWSDGPVSSPLIYSEQYAGGGADLSMAAGDYGTRDESGSLGFNVGWVVNDRLSLELDYHNSFAEETPNSPWGSSNTLSTAAFIRNSAATDFTGDVPVLAVGMDNPLDPTDMRVTGSVFGYNKNRSEIEQTQLFGEYLFDHGGSIDFGMAMTDVDNRTQSSNVQRNDWGGVGAPGDLDPDWFPAGTVLDKFDGSKGDFSLYQGGASTDPLNTIFLWDFAAVRDFAAANYASSVIGDCGNGFCPTTNFDTDRYTVEESLSAYLQYNYEGEWGTMPYNFHLGVRYEKTDVTSTSKVINYTSATWIADTEIALNQDQLDPSVFETQKGDYEYWLPNLNFNIEVMDDLYVRAAYSETIGRPDYVSIQGGTTLGTLANKGGGSGSTGNPALEPLESTNYDLSAEWYYEDANYVSVGFFLKDVTNFIDATPVTQSQNGITNPANSAWVQEAIDAGFTESADQRAYILDNYGPDSPNPSPLVSVNPANGNVEILGGPNDPLMDFIITRPSNSDRKQTIDGWEFAFQHFFGDTGLGLQANYTLVNGDEEYNNYNLNREGDTPQNVIIGISDTANVVAMYENYGFQARLAYNWRDQFLSSTGQGTGANPQYTEEYYQVDFSVSYDVPVVKGLTVFVEGLNVTDEKVRIHGRSEEQVLNYVQTGARYSLGARYTF